MYSKFYLGIISFLVGIVVSELLHMNWALPVFILLVSSFISLFLFIRKESSAEYIFIICTLLSVGMLRSYVAQNNGDIKLLSQVGQNINISGQIISEPDERDTTIRYTLKPEGYNSNILVVSNRFPKFDYGDKVNVSGKLSLPQNFISDTGIDFDYVSYLSKDNIYFTVYQPKIERVSTGGNIIFKYLFSLKNYFIHNVSAVVPEPNSSFISGLIFGDRQSIGDELLNEMKNVGLIHVVAISGYNVTIVAVAILTITAYFGRRKLGLIISIVGITLFSIMVGLGSTVVRASIMSIIAIFAKYIGRQSEALRALALAVFAMLLWNPTLLLRDPSFQLSCMATLGLILYSPIVFNFISNSKLNTFMTEKYGLREVVSSTFAVQIFLLPLLIKMSGIVSLVSSVVNLIVLPMVPPAMLLGFLTGVSGIFGTVVSFPLGALSYITTEIIIKIVDISSSLPFAYFQLGPIAIWVLIICYMFYAWIFWTVKKKENLIIS